MNEHPIQNLMSETMDKIKSMVDVDTVVGTPITTPDGTTVIPVSRVSFGFGSGGTDFQSKHAGQNAPMCFGGGGGAGVTVSPVCFLVISPTEGTHVLGINAQAVTTADRLVEMLPGAVSKVSGFFAGRKEGAAAQAEPSDTPPADAQTPDSDPA